MSADQRGSGLESAVRPDSAATFDDGVLFFSSLSQVCIPLYVREELMIMPS